MHSFLQGTYNYTAINSKQRVVLFRCLLENSNLFHSVILITLWGTPEIIAFFS